MGQISLSVCRKDVLHSGKLRPYSQTLDQAGESCQGQTHYFIWPIRKLQRIKGFLHMPPVLKY